MSWRRSTNFSFWMLPILANLKVDESSSRSKNVFLVCKTGTLFHGIVIWMNSHLDEQSFGWTVIWMNSHLDEQSFGWTVIWMNSHLDEQSFGWTVIRVNSFLGCLRMTAPRVSDFLRDLKIYRFGSLSYKTFLADIVVIYDVILTLEKSASIAIVMYKNKIELLSKQKKL
jgi:hypothetical protein